MVVTTHVREKKLGKIPHALSPKLLSVDHISGKSKEMLTMYHCCHQKTYPS